ncbi:hypothetical protein [uncultured Desulfobulbus sp.]|uniref:hypothetical protein n=1 Tax=uncultured Desulfobulbus sp. TaxID=239745 RepID=UPI002635EF81|nr:hypothetical protein [uncultured Desulfobulbus sp.]
MTGTGLPTGWRLVQIGQVVRNVNQMERNPEAPGIERIVGRDYLAPENPHIQRWNAVADGKEFAPTTTRTRITTIGKLP